MRYAAKSIHNPFDYTASSARAAMHAWDSSAVLATSTWWVLVLVLGVLLSSRAPWACAIRPALQNRESERFVCGGVARVCRRPAFLPSLVQEQAQAQPSCHSGMRTCSDVAYALIVLRSL